MFWPAICCEYLGLEQDKFSKEGGRMKSGTTTREILQNRISSEDYTPLYSKEALKKINDGLKKWKSKSLSEKDL
jgi:predicted DNA-binding protein